MGMIRILREIEDAMITKLKRIRGGKWRLVIYLYYLPFGLLGIILGVLLIPIVAAVCIILLSTFFEQGASVPLSKKIDLILAIIGLSLLAVTVIHLCARVMYHMMRGKRDEAP